MPFQFKCCVSGIRSTPPFVYCFDEIWLFSKYHVHCKCYVKELALCRFIAERASASSWGASRIAEFCSLKVCCSNDRHGFVGHERGVANACMGAQSDRHPASRPAGAAPTCGAASPVAHFLLIHFGCWPAPPLIRLPPLLNLCLGLLHFWFVFVAGCELVFTCLALVSPPLDCSP